MPLRQPHSLHHRIVLWLLAFALALTVAVIAQGTVVIEYVERIVWRSMLMAELDHFIQRSRNNPGYHWDETAGFVIHVGAGVAPAQGSVPDHNASAGGANSSLTLAPRIARL